MKHLKKYNESNKQFDAEFFNSVFAEFLDNDKVQCEYLDGTYWEIFIPIPDIRRATKRTDTVVNKRKFTIRNERDIDDYLNISKEILDIMEDIKVAIDRVKNEYPNIEPKITEEDEENYWLVHISYGVE